jgi:hypothetical protein
MLVAGCSNCRSVAPLWCAGQFMPHAPLYVEASPMGPFCGWCGQMPPVFTCFQCGTRQGLYTPGMAVQRAMGPGLVAPAFQASEGASPNQILRGLVGVAKVFLNEAAKTAGQNMGNSMTAWNQPQ